MACGSVDELCRSVGEIRLSVGEDVMAVHLVRRPIDLLEDGRTDWQSPGRIVSKRESKEDTGDLLADLLNSLTLSDLQSSIE